VSDKVLRKATGPRDFSRAIARIDKMQSTSYDLPATDISQTKSDYLKLSVPTARRMQRFWLVRGATKTDA
jgi:hypothetical protein